MAPLVGDTVPPPCLFLNKFLIIRSNTTMQKQHNSPLLYITTCFGCPEQPSTGRCRVSLYIYFCLSDIYLIMADHKQPKYVVVFGRIISNLIKPLNAELNPICHLLALLGVHHFLHVSRIRVKSLTLRLLMSYRYIYIYIYIYGAPILDVSRSHTTTHHSR